MAKLQPWKTLEALPQTNFCSRKIKSIEHLWDQSPSLFISIKTFSKVLMFWRDSLEKKDWAKEIRWILRMDRILLLKTKEWCKDSVSLRWCGIWCDPGRKGRLHHKIFLLKKILLSFFFKDFSSHLGDFLIRLDTNYRFKTLTFSILKSPFYHKSSRKKPEGGHSIAPKTISANAASASP